MLDVHATGYAPGNDYAPECHGCPECSPLAAAHEAVADAALDLADLQSDLAEAEARVLRLRTMVRAADHRLAERLVDLSLVEAAADAIARLDALTTGTVAA